VYYSILLCGRRSCTHRQVAGEFHINHSERNTVTHSAAGELTETGSVGDEPRTGRPSCAEEVSVQVLTARI
jgi:hypothetical protein